jgi:hypothetical protein
MNDKDLKFFGEKGLTSTSAQYIANLAKEYCEEQKSKLTNLRFFTTELALIGSDSITKLNEGNTDKDVNEIPRLISEISDATSLIAWMREAMKAKERIVDYWKNYGLVQYCKDFNLKYMEYPIADEYMTEDAYYATLSVKERNEFYTLQAYASELGKAIHNHGYLDKARSELNQIINSPTYTAGEGRDTVIYTRTPTATTKAVDECFYGLQTLYRSIQSRLNSMKHDCKTTLDKNKADVNAKLQTEIQEYKEYMGKLHGDCTAYAHDKCVEATEYKIVIPNNLEKIYQKINSLGK